MLPFPCDYTSMCATNSRPIVGTRSLPPQILKHQQKDLERSAVIPAGRSFFQLLHNSSTTPPRSRRASKVSSQALNTASYTPARKQRDSPITHSYFNLTIPAGATPITLPNRRGYLILLDLRLCNRLNKPITQRETSAKRQRETSAKINTKL